MIKDSKCICHVLVDDMVMSAKLLNTQKVNDQSNQNIQNVALALENDKLTKSGGE